MVISFPRHLSHSSWHPCSPFSEQQFLAMGRTFSSQLTRPFAYSIINLVMSKRKTTNALPQPTPLSFSQRPYLRQKEFLRR